MEITVVNDEKKEILILFKLLLDNKKITPDEYRKAVDLLNKIVENSNTKS